MAHAEIVNSNDKGTTFEYLVDKFLYNKVSDTYTCPQGQTLSTSGTWHHKQRTERAVGYHYKKYRSKACKDCPVRSLCTAKADGKREIERSEFAVVSEANTRRYKANGALYRKRQEINEHIFGTIKRKWGYNHTNLKGLEKVNGEMSLIMSVYNFKRVLNILKFDLFLEKLKNWKPDYDKIILAFCKNNLMGSTMALSFFQIEYSLQKNG